MLIKPGHYSMTLVNINEDTLFEKTSYAQVSCLDY